MSSFRRAYLPLLFITALIASSGCISDPTSFAKSIPVVQEFLAEHPNAEISIVHYSKLEAESIIDWIKEDCGKLSVEPKEYYFVNITDPSERLFVRAWIDWNDKVVECVFKEGNPNVPVENCTSLYEVRCFGDHLYWFDSCGNREKKKEYCPLGCSNGRCVTGKTCDIEKAYTEKPDCVCPDGYEMIVLYPRCADPVTGMVTGLPFAVTKDVAENAVTTESGAVEISPRFTTDFEGRCPDAKPVYKCIPKSECKSHAQTRCYRGHVYWFDSCGHVQEKKEYCEEGCENGFCKDKSLTCEHCEREGGYCFPEQGAETCKEGYYDAYTTGDHSICCLPRKRCEDAGGYCIYPSTVACPEDAKVCPDGTTVSRVPPSCDFAPCPEEVPENITKSSGGETDTVTGMMTEATAETSQEHETTSSDGGEGCEKYYTCPDGSTVQYCELKKNYDDSGNVVGVGCLCRKDPEELCTSSSGSGSGGSSSSYSQCREGYYTAPEYYCPGNGICCLPKQEECRSHYEYKCHGDHVYWFDSCGHVQEKKEYCEHGCRNGRCLEKEEFCGSSTYAPCGTDDDCEPGGCSGQLCMGVNEDMGTTCEYRDCYNAESFGMTCGCHNGKCQWSRDECSETDNGYDIYRKGCAEKGSSVLCDHCNSDGTLTEKYCDNGEIKARTTECPDGYSCRDGACIANEPVCSDSDGGKEFYTAGYVEYGETVSEDYCSNDTVVVEYYCLNSVVKSERLSCPYSCKEGACIPEEDNQVNINYSLYNYPASMSTYARWNPYIRDGYLEDELYIAHVFLGEGRNGYYTVPVALQEGGGFSQVGYCTENLCIEYGQTELEIFNFPPIGDCESVSMQIFTHTRETYDWFKQIGFDVYVNNQKIGSGVSAERGESRIAVSYTHLTLPTN